VTNGGSNGWPTGSGAGEAKLDPRYASYSATHSGNLLATGEEVIPRFLLSVTAIASSSQQLRLTFFTARKSETVTQVRMITSTTAAAATPSLCRIGLYSVDGYGNGVLVAATPSDTTLFAAATTAYTKSFTSAYAKVAGQRYALGALVVSGTTMPTMAGIGADISPGGRTEMSLAPRLSGSLSSQADLPASFTDAGLTASQVMCYGAVLP
jgi:hypothetical protein